MYQVFNTFFLGYDIYTYSKYGKGRLKNSKPFPLSVTWRAIETCHDKMMTLQKLNGDLICQFTTTDALDEISEVPVIAKAEHEKGESRVT